MSRLPWLPPFAQTIRFRLTVLYTGLLFVLAATVLGVIYLSLRANSEDRPYTKEYVEVVNKRGEVLGKQQVVLIEEVENLVNLKSQSRLLRYSGYTLGGLFVASLGIGWVLSGRVLRPVRSITRTAAEIQATDLSRRIRLQGPKDELRDLADTVDTMLDRLEDGFRAQRQLIDDASHELRTPLAIIRANVDAVLSSPESTEAERMRAADIVDRATTRMTRLVEDLLATARRAAPALADADMDVGVVAAEACDEFTTLAAERALEITRRLPTGLIAIGDPDALRRAVGNLLSNAVRLAPPGSSVAVAAGRRQGWLWIAVRDAGPGLAEDDQPRVFDRFWRAPAHTTPSSRDRHTGLGLAIVRQIVESHGGQVRLFSKLGSGSTFVLWLPARGANPTHAPDDNPLEPAAQPLAETPRRGR